LADIAFVYPGWGCAGIPIGGRLEENSFGLTSVQNVASALEGRQRLMQQGGAAEETVM